MSSRDLGGWWAALAGIVAAGAGLALAELVAAFVDPASSPVLALGGAFIDVVPPWLKDFAVEWFGTADKAVLLASMGAVLAAGAALAGWLERRVPPSGAVLLGAVGLVLALVAMNRPGATAAWMLPSVIGVGAAVVLLRLLVARVPARRADPAAAAPATTAPAATAPVPDGAASRRTFLAWSGIAAAGAVVAVVASRAVSAGSRAVEVVREAIRLPAPASPAPPVPPGADLEVPGAEPYISPNDNFYRIDTALRVPAVDPAEWSLRVTGLVDEPFELTWDELLELPMTEHHVTLACVSNPVGGDLIGNALWLGYPIRELLARARPQAGADMVLSTSVDGWTAGTPLEILTDPDRESLLAIGMNGEPLPEQHGFPARLVVPGLYGYVSATKWVTELKVTRFADDEGYWTPRGWSARGPVKLQSRIDVPRSGSVDAGEVVVAGVAWAQHIGIDAVEVSVDAGPWQPAQLAETVGPDTWRQWRYVWDAPVGGHTIAVRAIGADGQVQTSDEAPPAPDGATGWHTVGVSVD
ncbi:DMSO/TMAO reductase YedYZ molybdopterin-dependent catalytic subunit [Isoptericola sp. CG 20/1183]|uniref:DMSO/TMAO reductase YedYZ molybdopterin-dependent catalytic subunit n=1 Tax=Isoptericola halotolerans TaxID=300560 RepID=A0ABX5ED53_9MICO|nr:MULTISPECIES: molybdopterin-dependent oxidoreductase [Isoptericola]PRZ05699.1 DMSO/TMAO reductase YedYZ molybdopterin-dependent catalytic subunit [Isoptericola halotolerans]PRZ06267.1 DMSO/TMAO reductase YedYZ molybdopterin-dependent catalytic subunit [Isoptericola sp. CG 20/1183]